VTGRRADRGWLTIVEFVLGHNVVAAGRGDEMLSEAFDRYLAKYPVLMHAVVVLVGLHLLNRLPRFADPLAAVMGGLARAVGPLR
jgi:hypothetical protein